MIRRTDIPEGDGNKKFQTSFLTRCLLEEPISPKGTETPLVPYESSSKHD